MSDKFLLKAICDCGEDLNQPSEITGERLFLRAFEDNINLTCPKCKTKWNFKIGIKIIKKKK